MYDKNENKNLKSEWAVLMLFSATVNYSENIYLSSEHKVTWYICCWPASREPSEDSGGDQVEPDVPAAGLRGGVWESAGATGGAGARQAPIRGVLTAPDQERPGPARLSQGRDDHYWDEEEERDR